MTQNLSTTTRPRSSLRERLDRLREESPKLRERDMAEALGVSEAELLACCIGEGIVELEPDWARILPALPALGEVMALTRNDAAVHEKVGRFDNVELKGSHALVVTPDIDLRIFLSRWRFAFSVEKQTPKSIRRSLQFFDQYGTAVHKVFLRDASDLEAFAAIVEQNHRAEQRDSLPVAALAEAEPDRDDSVIDVQTLRSRWNALEDTHDFAGMLRELDLGRVQALRLAGPDLACRVVDSAVEEALQRLATEGLPLMCFVGNPGCTQIHTGPVNNLKWVKQWFNVLDPGFNLHLNTDGIDSVWVVRKPTRDGIMISLEAYDAKRSCILRLFAKRDAGEPQPAAWLRVLEDLPSYVTD